MLRRASANVRRRRRPPPPPPPPPPLPSATSECVASRNTPICPCGRVLIPICKSLCLCLASLDQSASFGKYAYVCKEYISVSIWMQTYPHTQTRTHTRTHNRPAQKNASPYNTNPATRLLRRRGRGRRRVCVWLSYFRSERAVYFGKIETHVFGSVCVCGAVHLVCMCLCFTNAHIHMGKR